MTVPVVAVLLAPCASAWALDDSAMVEVRGGKAVFEATTNVSAIGVRGKSTALEGHARVRMDADRLVIERLEATLPVKTLNTGMRLRDAHMRKHVFTTSDGQVPDLRFSLGEATCSGSSERSTCHLSGELAVRGTSRPFTIALKVTRSGGAFRAVGDGIVKLSAYGIVQPSQLGIKAQDAVKLHLDFVAHPSSNAAGAGATR